MSLAELMEAIGTNCEKCEKADQEGRPVEMRAQLVDIKARITEFLGEPNAVDEEPAEKKETTKAGSHCQPDQT